MFLKYGKFKRLKDRALPEGNLSVNLCAGRYEDATFGQTQLEFFQAVSMSAGFLPSTFSSSSLAQQGGKLINKMLFFVKKTKKWKGINMVRAKKGTFGIFNKNRIWQMI